MPEYVLVRSKPNYPADYREVLSRMGIEDLFWADAETAGSLGYRYAVKYPSQEAAEKGAAIYGAEPIAI